MSNIIYIDKNGKLNLSKLRPKQQEFVRSQRLHTGIVGGYQSGKSLSAVIKVITKLLINPNVPIAYYLPTYGLIKDMLIPKFKQLFSDINLKEGTDYTIHNQESKIITRWGEIWMRSMDNPDRIVSYSVGYSVVDEVDVVHKNKRDDVMKRISSRNSFKKETPNSIDFVSTPEGFAYMYQFFVKKSNENKTLIRLSTLDNKDNLGIGYIQGLREQYSEQQLEAYLNGYFVNLTSGSVFNDYDRERHNTDKEATDKSVLHIGMDFNVTNMSAVVHIKDGVNSYAVDEFVGLYDTNTMINAIKERYPNNYIYIYPDASGNARKTVGADVTDIILLKKAGFKVKVDKSNPRVKERTNETNRAFRNGTYFVNKNKCPNYVEALEQLAYKSGVPDKSSGLDHIADAGTYFIIKQRRRVISIR